MSTSDNDITKTTATLQLPYSHRKSIMAVEDYVELMRGAAAGPGWFDDESEDVVAAYAASHFRAR